jgi:hypothetical protein
MGKKYIVRLTMEERERLQAVVSKGRASARKISHARVLLKVDADGPNWTDQQTAETFEIRANTVRDIRQRFVEEGFDAALERKRREEPPTPRKLDGAGEARVERDGHCGCSLANWWNWRSSMGSHMRRCVGR